MANSEILKTSLRQKQTQSNDTAQSNDTEEAIGGQTLRALQSGLGDWELCSCSSQCRNGCCSKTYSNDGRLKCTPVGGYRPDICVAPTSTSTKLGDWALCSSSSQCQNGCCSKAYSNDGKLKCTPLSGGYRPDICVVTAGGGGGGTGTGNEMLDRHNMYRREVGVPDLQWSDALVASAKAWADQLAASGAFQHSRSGENLAKATSGSRSAGNLVQLWADEKKFFKSGSAFPGVSTTGRWEDVGHYTQVVWRGTTQVGCGLSTGRGWDVLVCHYSPPGNVIGQMTF